MFILESVEPSHSLMNKASDAHKTPGFAGFAWIPTDPGKAQVHAMFYGRPLWVLWDGATTLEASQAVSTLRVMFPVKQITVSELPPTIGNQHWIIKLFARDTPIPKVFVPFQVDDQGIWCRRLVRGVTNP